MVLVTSGFESRRLAQRARSLVAHPVCKTGAHAGGFDPHRPHAAYGPGRTLRRRRPARTGPGISCASQRARGAPQVLRRHRRRGVFLPPMTLGVHSLHGAAHTARRLIPEPSPANPRISAGAKESRAPRSRSQRGEDQEAHPVSRLARPVGLYHRNSACLRRCSAKPPTSGRLGTSDALNTMGTNFLPCRKNAM